MIASIEPIVETLEALETDLDRYEYLIELGDDLAEIGVKEMLNDENYVAGCQSDVWLTHILDENKTLQFYVQKIPLGAQLSMQRQIGMMSVFKKMQYISKQYTASA